MAQQDFIAMPTSLKYPLQKHAQKFMTSRTHKGDVKDQKFPQGDGYDFGNPDDFIVLHNHTNGYFERYVTNKIFVSSPSFVWALNNIGEHPFLYRDKEALGNSKDAAVLHQLNENMEF